MRRKKKPHKYCKVAKYKEKKLLSVLATLKRKRQRAEVALAGSSGVWKNTLTETGGRRDWIGCFQDGGKPRKGITFAM